MSLGMFLGMFLDTSLDTGEHRSEIDACILWKVQIGLRRQQVAAADDLIQRAKTEIREQLPDVFGDRSKKLHNIFRGAGELLLQASILSCDANRAGI